MPPVISFDSVDLSSDGYASDDGRETSKRESQAPTLPSTSQHNRKRCSWDLCSSDSDDGDELQVLRDNGAEQRPADQAPYSLLQERSVPNRTKEATRGSFFEAHDGDMGWHKPRRCVPDGGEETTAAAGRPPSAASVGRRERRSWVRNDEAASEAANEETIECPICFCMFPLAVIEAHVAAELDGVPHPGTFEPALDL